MNIKKKSYHKESGNGSASNITLYGASEETATFSPNYDNNNEASSDYLVCQHNELLSSDVVQQNVDRRKRLLMYFTKLYVQSKVIKFPFFV